MPDDTPSYLDFHLKRSRNVILLRGQIGKSKPSIYEIPAGMTFGIPNPADTESAASIVNGWVPHKKSVLEKDRAVFYPKWNKVLSAGKFSDWGHVNLPKLQAASPALGNGKGYQTPGVELPRATTVSDIDLSRDDYARRRKKINKIVQDQRSLLSIQQLEKRQIFEDVVKHIPLETLSPKNGSPSGMSTPRFDDKDLVHGRRKYDGPGTPVEKIIRNEYGKEGAKNLIQQYHDYLRQKKMLAAVKERGDTKASAGHALKANLQRELAAAVAAHGPMKKWALKKFSNIEGVLSKELKEQTIPGRPERVREYL